MNDRTKDELLPCPFCGGNPERGQSGEDEFNQIVSCDNCGACTDWYMTEDHATEAWNKRVSK